MSSSGGSGPKTAAVRHNWFSFRQGAEYNNRLPVEGDYMETGLSVVIPAKNEVESVGQVVTRILHSLAGTQVPSEVIVVDDGSDDGTGRAAAEAGATVLTNESSRGYGASLKLGIRASSHETIAIADADGTYPVERIPELYGLLEGYAMVVGARTGDSVAIPAMRKPAKWVVRKLASFIAGVSIPDVNSGLRVFRSKVALRYFRMLPSGFSFTTTITVACLCDSLPVRFVPIDYRPRSGRSKLNAMHFFNFLALVARLSVLFRPLRVFIPAATALLALGVLKAVLDVTEAADLYGWSFLVEGYEVISTSSAVLLILGGFLFMTGMLADALAVHRPGTDF